MAESGNMFFDQYNKVFPEMQEKVVPLAMRKMQMDIENEKFNMALEAAKAEQANKLAEEEFLKNNPITSRKDLIKLLPFAKDKAGFAEKVLQDEKPTFHTIGEGQKLVSGEGNVIAEGNPKAPKTPNIKSVDLGDRVDIYKDGVYAGTLRKGLSPAGANASGNGTSIKDKTAELQAYIDKNYTPEIKKLEDMGIAITPEQQAKLKLLYDSRQQTIDTINAVRNNPNTKIRWGAGLPKSNGAPTQPANDKRSQAIKILNDNKQPVTEANINYVMGQI